MKMISWWHSRGQIYFWNKNFFLILRVYFNTCSNCAISRIYCFSTIIRGKQLYSIQRCHFMFNPIEDIQWSKLHRQELWSVFNLFHILNPIFHLQHLERKWQIVAQQQLKSLLLTIANIGEKAFLESSKNYRVVLQVREASFLIFLKSCLEKTLWHITLNGPFITVICITGFHLSPLLSAIICTFLPSKNHNDSFMLKQRPMPGTGPRNAFQTHSQSPQTSDVGLGHCGGTITITSQRCNTAGMIQSIVHNKLLEYLSNFQFFT